MNRWLFAAVPALLWPLVTAAADTEPSARFWFESRDVRVGDADAVVPIQLINGQDLTLFAFDVVFSPPRALCDALADRGRLTVRRAGRTASERWEEPIDCERGRIRTVVGDLLGNTAIPKGAGPVFELALGKISAGGGTVVRVWLENITASAGPLHPDLSNLSSRGSCSASTRAPCLTDEDCRAPQCLTCAPDERCSGARVASVTIREALPTTSTTTSPAPTSTSTLPATTKADVPQDPTGLGAVRHRLGEFASTVSGVRGLDGTFATPLRKAESRLQLAEAMQSKGRGGSVRILLRRAVRDVRRFQHRLHARATMDASTRDSLLGTAVAIERDLGTLSRKTGK